MIEFAVCFLVLFPMFTGAFQFGYTFFMLNNLETAVRGGARYASLRKLSNAGDATVPTAFSDDVKNMVVYGNPSGGSSPIVPNLATSNVNLTIEFANGVPSTITVSVSGYTINSVFGSMACNGKPTLTYPYTGIYTPY